MVSNELKKVGIKNCMCYYFDAIEEKIKDSDFNNILVDEKSYENMMVGLLLIMMELNV